MKPKGINVFEQHVEKAVLGVACVAAAGLGAVQFLTQPNAVPVAGRELAPSEVDDALASKAAELKSKLDSDRGLEVQEPGRLSDWFDSEHAPAPADRRSASATPLVRAEKFKVGAGADAATIDLYAEFSPPAPKGVRALSAHYTLDPDAAPKIEGLSQYLSSAAPYDVSAVHVFATVDGKKVKESLTGTQVNRSIPASWWERDLNILDVTLERQRLQSSGQWSETEIVPALPGQTSLRPVIAATKPGFERALFDSALQAGTQVYQPDFLPLADNDQWSPEAGKPAVDLTNPELAAADKVVKSKWRNLNKAEETLERLKKAKDNDRNNTGRDEGGKGGGPSTETGGPEGTPTTKREDKPKPTPIERAEKTLETAKTEYAAAVKAALAIDAKYIAPDVQEKLDEEKERERTLARAHLWMSKAVAASPPPARAAAPASAVSRSPGSKTTPSKSGATTSPLSPAQPTATASSCSTPTPFSAVRTASQIPRSPSRHP